MPPSQSLQAFLHRLGLVVLTGALVLALWKIGNALLLTFMAILIAVAVHGTAGALTRWSGLPRPLGLAAATLLLVGTVGSVLLVFGTQISRELSGVLSQLPDAWQRASAEISAHPAGAVFVSEVNHFLTRRSGGSLEKVLTEAGAYALPFASALTSGLLVLFIAGFLTTSSAKTLQGALLLFPRGIDSKVEAALTASARALRKWLLGTSVDMVIVTLSMTLVLWLLGVPAFLGLALIAGLSQFVPTVGPLISAIPGILLAFTVSPATAAWTLLAYFVVSQLEANLIYPLIQQKAAAIPPALNLFAILTFGMLLGPLGILLATPILIVLTVFVVRLYIHDTLGKAAPVPGAS